MWSRARQTTLLILLAFTTACEATSQPPAPSTSSAPPGTQPPAAAVFAPIPTPSFPPVTRPARIFVYDPVQGPWDYDVASRFVLYDDRTFALQVANSQVVLGGTYTEEEGTFTFEGERSSTLDAWAATGALEGRSMTVRYNEVWNFEEKIYIWTE